MMMMMVMMMMTANRCYFCGCLSDEPDECVCKEEGCGGHEKNATVRGKESAYPSRASIPPSTPL
jgi:hypothetical protein